MKTLPPLTLYGARDAWLQTLKVVRNVARTTSILLVTSAGGSAWAAATADIEAKVAMCIGCHGIAGYQASFPEVHKVPMISGQNARYIAAALTAYQKGERKHPTMRGVAAPLSAEDIQQIAAYYEASGQNRPVRSVPGAPPSPEVQALLNKGNCAACHGEGLNRPIDGGYPKLAGQHADYLYVALKAYQSEGLPQIGRSNAIMAAQSRLFTHRELKLLASYVASLQGDLKTVPQAKFR